MPIRTSPGSSTYAYRYKYMLQHAFESWSIKCDTHYTIIIASYIIDLIYIAGRTSLGVVPEPSELVVLALMTRAGVPPSLHFVATSQHFGRDLQLFRADIMLSEYMLPLCWACSVDLGRFTQQIYVCLPPKQTTCIANIPRDEAAPACQYSALRSWLVKQLRRISIV